MTITIITATFNSGKTLKKTFDSLIQQSYQDFEYLVIDGNSQDNTLDIIRAYEDKFKTTGITFRWISESDHGVYDAWNKGVQMAKGEWICFLGSDDYFLKDALKKYAFEIKKEHGLEYDLVYSNVNIVSGDKILKQINGIWSWKTFRRYMNIAHVGAFHNRKYFENYGLFNSSYKISGDYELLLRSKSKLKTLKINEVTAIMGANGISNNNVSKVFAETFKAKHQTAGLSKLICFWDYLVAMAKYYLKRTLNASYR